MPSSSLRAVSFSKYRPAILALTAIAAGFIVYRLNSGITSLPDPSEPSSQTTATSLHRSNAQRRRRSHRQTNTSTSEPQVNAIPVPTDSEHREIDENETVAETGSNRSDGPEDENEEKRGPDQNLMNLLYRIAEDQAKKEGFVHRGVTCNSCNVIPIRGIRYRCTNCHDYDLCEQCEALQVHNKTHLFYKIRVPAPFLGNPRQPTPVWYPGKPGMAHQSLTTEVKMGFSTKLDMQDRQVEAYWEQFQCLAARFYPDDPYGFNVAIDREGYDQCFVPNVTPRPPPPNLVYDRMFSFYDTNDDGLIGFEEFLSGIACIAKNGKELRKRIFRAYDVDGDGFVNRRDFLRMFKANYALTKELTRQVVSGMDDEFFDEEDARALVAGSQPISSIFSGAIPQGEGVRRPEGKSVNRYGDMIIYDGQGILQDEENNQVYGISQDGDDIVADNAEFAHFGDRRNPWLPGIPNLTIETDDDKWSKSSVTARDVEEALGRVAAPNTVEDRAERSLVLCASQERAQQDRYVREAFRRRTVASRWRARQFYLDGESMIQPPWRAAEEELAEGRSSYPENDLSTLRIKALDRNEQMQFIEGYHEGLRREVREQWPNYPDINSVPTQFSIWIRKRYKWHNLAEALAPSRSEVPAATLVVRRVLNDYFHIRKFVTPKRSSDAKGSPPYSPTEDVLRSNAQEISWEGGDGIEDNGCRAISSKGTVVENVSSHMTPEEALAERPDRDDDHERHSTKSSSSESLGVLHGEGHKVEDRSSPEIEADIGREVIYQVTQESMNELLDPVFKFREDLAIEVAKTRQERDLYRNEINDCLQKEFVSNCMDLIQEYQKRWYQSPREEFDMLGSSQSIKFLQFTLQCLRKLESQGPHRSNGSVTKGKDADANSTSLQKVTEAIIQLDQSVASEVHSESLSPTTAQQQVTDTAMSTVNSDGLPPPTSPFPATAIELHESVITFDEADLAVEETAKQKPLELLLADAGYGIMTPPVQDFDESDTSLVSSPESTSVKGAEEDLFDPTLPHNRPDSPSEWESRYGNPQASLHDEATSQRPSIRTASVFPETESLPPLSEEKLWALAIWNIVEEDDKRRGGPGRLNLHDYELIMEGDKGRGLGFLGSWVETAAF